MSIVGNNRVGIPIVLLHDAEGAVVSVETKNGEIIRGLLFEAEDMMNLYIKNAIVWNVNGRKRKVDQLYLRGTEIVFIVIPNMLVHAPMFQRIKHWRKYGGAPPEGVGAAVGQAAAILRKAQERRRGGIGGYGGGGNPGRGGAAGGNNTRNNFNSNTNMGGRGGMGNNNMGMGGRPGVPGQYGPR